MSARTFARATVATLAMVVIVAIASCAKKSSSCDAARQLAMEAIHTAHAAVEKDLEANLGVEAKLAQAKVDLAGAPAPPELAKQQFEAHTKTAGLQLRLAMLNSWLASLGTSTPATVSAAPDRDEPALVTTARTLVVAYAAQCST